MLFYSIESEVDSLPLWLRSLMTLCCLSRDYNIQHTAVASLLEFINHSQSLALVIQDKHRRYQTSDANPLSGRLQMVTVPPIFPTLLRAIEEGTDFYQVRLEKVKRYLKSINVVYYDLTILCCDLESVPSTVEPAGHGAEGAAHFLRGTILQASLFGSISVDLRRHYMPGAITQRQGVCMHTAEPLYLFLDVPV